MKPFDFQEEFMLGISNEFVKGNKRVIGNAITGFGKTVVGANITQRAIKKGNVVCILVHREEILHQFMTALMAVGIHPSLIIPGHHPMRSKVYLGMVETFSRRMKKDAVQHLGINFFILDEIHWGSYPKVVQELNCYVLGLTASPKSTGKPELNELFDSIVVGANVQEMIAMGRLVPAQTFSVKHDFSKVKKKGKDFEEQALLKEFRKAELHDGAVKKYFKTCPDRKAICYCVNIEHALETLVQFKDGGVKNLYHIDGEGAYYLHRNGEIIKGDRKDVFKSFQEDEYAILTNVGVATTGTDCPSVRCIIKNFATMSLVKNVQVDGRGARICPEIGKEDFYIIDMGRNWVRFGRYGQLIDWKGIFEDPSKANPADEKEDKKNERECGECGMVIPMKTKICGYCGDITSDAEIEKMIMADAPLELIQQHRIDTMPIHLRKNFNQMNKSELIQYGQHMNYDHRWAHIMFNKTQQRRPR